MRGKGRPKGCFWRVPFLLCLDLKTPETFELLCCPFRVLDDHLSAGRLLRSFGAPPFMQQTGPFLPYNLHLREGVKPLKHCYCLVGGPALARPPPVRVRPFRPLPQQRPAPRLLKLAMSFQKSGHRRVHQLVAAKKET